MTTPVSIDYSEVALEPIAGWQGSVAVFIGAQGKLDRAGRRVNRLTRGALARLGASDAFAKMKPGEVKILALPAGMVAETLLVVRLDRRPSVEQARRAGAALGKHHATGAMLVLAGSLKNTAELSLGLALRGYDFSDHKTADEKALGAVTIMASDPEGLATAARQKTAVAEGVFFTRDLVNEPANILTTTDFAARLDAMKSIGLDIEILEEEALEKLGMRALLAVGQGSESPTKVVVMQWNGGKKGDAPLALIGKGVVFDTGGISIKPAAGMEDMTMDMGGAGVVAGVMRTLALRGAAANVVGVVGLVENMPDGKAVRPGDVVKSMKGDTVEVINTDAEGRLVLADVLWYAQERFKPAGMVDLATLTGAIIVGLGHENAGVFSNDDTLCGAFLKAASAEGEGAWRLPLAKAYDDLLKSRVADMKNVGGRAAGSITAAQFLQRFVLDTTPWIHLDIAGVASVKSDTTLAP
ncbi:MAG: leucyl aminopeptidase, partial [Halocynthiibacter sp.]